MEQRVSRPVALSLIREGRLRAIKVGLRGQWRIDENAITEFLRGGRGEEKKQTTA
jgi:excisionase family DNA binding protein